MRFEGSSPPSPPRSPPTSSVDRRRARRRNVERCSSAGMHGFVATGTMGEAGASRARSAAP